MQAQNGGKRHERFAPALILGLALAAPAGAQVGSPDPTFGGGDGIVTTDHQILDLGFDVFFEPDGKILLAGRTGNNSPVTRNAIVVRYNADGSVNLLKEYNVDDCSGGPGTPDDFRALVRESSGNYLAAGFRQFGCTGQGGERDFWVARLEPVALGLIFNFDFPSFTGASDTQADSAHDLLIQPDGKVVAVGRTNQSSATSRDFAIARWEADGDLDPTFSSDGAVVVDFAGDNDFGLAAALQADGKIVIAGFATTATGQEDTALARLLPDGSLDTSFGGGDGKVITDFAGLDDRALDVIAQADGTILVAGSRTDSGGAFDAVVLRYTSAGVLDPSFGNAGVALVDFGTPLSQLTDILVEPSGKILGAGVAETGAGGVDTRDFAIARLLPDGSLDTTFSGDGRQTVDITGTGQEDNARTIALQTNDGGILVGGWTRDQSVPTADLALIRLSGDAFTPGATVTPTSGLITTEAGGSDNFNVVLTSRPTQNVTIGLSSSDTTEGTVSTTPPTSPPLLTFTPANWNVAQTVTVTGVNDPNSDGDQTYTILTAATNSADSTYDGINPADVSVTNQDDDVAAPGSLQFSAASYSVGEGGGQATITVTRSGGSDGAVSVDFATANGSATAGSDYTTTMTTVTFADGDSADKTVNVPILDDTADEPDETVALSLSNPTGGASLGSPSTANLTITDNDAAPPTPPTVASLSLSVSQVQEENPAAKSAHDATITATLSDPATSPVTVTLGFSGQAQNGTDFIVTGNPIVIQAGNTSGNATLAAADDTQVEGDETFTVFVQSATGADVPDPPPQAQGVIVDDDQAQAAPVTPIPTLGVLGLLLMSLLIPIAGWWWMRRGAV